MSTPAEFGTENPGPKLPVRVFLSGDVMTGRGIDQILPHPCDPRIHEPVVSSAEGYVRLAEEANGPIARPVNFEYVWGAALEELKDGRPAAYIVNLETSITRCRDFLPKGINYRMSPENAGCLLAANIDCCVLANNHVLDWGHVGLVDTLVTLEKLGIRTVGAGRNLLQARTSAVLDVGANRRVVVFAFASLTSGTPKNWAAEEGAAGVNLLLGLSDENAIEIASQVAQIKRPGDIVIISIHWGPNWGYDIPQEQRRFAHKLIDEADASAIFGHSSHHAKAIEVYRDRLILYGCGDFLNDYEGIAGYEKYRDDLTLLYAATFAAVGADLIGLELVPFQIRRLQLIRPSSEDVAWLRRTLERESRRFGVSVRLQRNGKLAVSWARENTVT
jgi:poly-gamma-glutamate capsule biosynthesis protein CapA/YwtB (metallophosphatase superfamily)